MELFSYLLKVSACSALFFAFYLLVLSKLTFFKINRFYLLASLLISFIIPALQFKIERESLPSNEVLTNTRLQTEFFYPSNLRVNSLQTSGTGNFNWLNALPYIYGFIVVGLFCLAVWRLIQLFRETRSSSIKMNGLTIVPKTSGFTNCSFFNYVFIDENRLTEAELIVLLRHEEVHVKQYHSIDKLFLMLVKAVLWFNPIVYLYDKELEQTHEFEADEIASKNIGIEQYANLLLNLAVSKSDMPIVHNFVKSPLKQRIKMLFNSKSKRMKKLAYLIILPIGMCLIWSFTIKIVYSAPSNKEGSVFSIKNIAAVVIPTATKIKENDTVLAQKSLEQGTMNDTLRLVGSSVLGKNPKVIIDGKLYESSILTKISPRSIKSTMTIPNQITITTRNNKIEYATKIDIENFKVTRSLDQNKLYLRYPQRKDDGSSYEVVKINRPNGNASMEVPKGSRVLILSKGEKLTERQAKAMDKNSIVENFFPNITAKDMPDFNKLYDQYAKDYDVVIDLGIEPDNQLKITDDEISLEIGKHTTEQQLESYKFKLKAKNIDVDFTKVQRDENNRLKAITIIVNCNDGFRGSASSDFKDGEGNVGFYRTYNTLGSPFGTGAMPGGSSRN